MSDEFTIPEQFRSELRDALIAHAYPVPRRQPEPMRWRRLRLRIGAAVTVGAAIAAVVLGLGSGGEFAPQPASAASVLRTSAGALQRSGGLLALAPGDYLYIKTSTWFRYTQLAPRPIVVRSIKEQWTARDGTGRDRDQVVSDSRGRGGPGDPTRSTDYRLRATARPFLLSSAPSISLSYTQLRRLPANPAGLRAVVDRIAARDDVARQFPSGQWQAVVKFALLRGLAQTPAPPRVRAALYRVLASTPGIRLVGRRTDSVGRTGVAVAVTLAGAIRLELIIDPSTGDLLQTSRTLLHRSPLMAGQPVGLVNRDTFLLSAVVKSTHSRPR
jgi:hypothetical protein